MIESILSTPFWLAMLRFLVGSTLFLSLSWVLSRHLASYRQRDFLWKLTLVASLLLLIPLFHPLAPTVQLAASQEAAEALAPANARAEANAEPEATAATAVYTPRQREARAAAPVSDQSVLPAPSPESLLPPERRVQFNVSGSTLLLVVWAAVSLSLLLRLLYAYRQGLRRLGIRQRIPAGDRRVKLLTALCSQMEVSPVPSLTQSKQIASPVTLPRNEICLPAWSDEESFDRVGRATLAHELAHIKAKDLQWQALLHVLTCLFFFQPLLHLAQRRIKDCAEFLADERAARTCGDSDAVAQALLDCADRMRSRTPLRWGFAMVDKASLLNRRLQALESIGLLKSTHRFGFGVALTLLVSAFLIVPSFESAAIHAANSDASLQSIARQSSDSNAGARDRNQNPAMTSDISPELQAYIEGNLTLDRINHMVIGVVDAGGHRYYSYGALNDGSGNVPDENTPYPIGSLTKTFTGVLLADLIQRSELELESAISAVLPHRLNAIDAAEQITLLDLATHESGLPSNQFAAGLDSPTTLDQMVDALSDFMPPQGADAGRYSNLAYSLLGAIVSERIGMDYDRLLAMKLFEPLGMDNTGIDQESYYPRAPVGMNLQGAGGANSTVKDLLRFAEANLGLIDSPLAGALEFTHSLRTENNVGSLGIGWYLIDQGDATILHNGGSTGLSGDRITLFMSKQDQTAVVILANVVTWTFEPNILRMARHVLDGSTAIDVAGLDRPAQLRNFVRPEFPADIDDPDTKGFVDLELTLDNNGAVTNARVSRSELAGVFDEAAIAAAMRLQFSPRVEDGVIVATSGVEYRFDF